MDRQELEDKTLDSSLRRILSGMNMSCTVAVMLLLVALIRGALFGGWLAAREPLLIGVAVLLIAEAIGFIVTIWSGGGE